MTKTLALTGATGFVGTALINLFIKDGYHVKALARDPARLSQLTSTEQVDIIKGDLEDRRALAELAQGTDWFVHCAGITHARTDKDYFKVNVDGAKLAAEAAAAASTNLVHLSSMSAREPSLSAYAASKRDSENAVFAAMSPASSSACIALRLPAIYGPGDMVTLPFFKAVKLGMAPEPATKPPARASILHVADAAGAVLAAITEQPQSDIYEVGDGVSDGHSWSEIGQTLGQAMGKKPRPVRIPRPIIALQHGAALGYAKLLKKVPEVRNGQINEFFHADWVAQNNLFEAATNWTPQFSLQEGIAKTVHWYQKNGYL